MTKRRASGEGSVYRIESGRDKGKWCAQVDMGWTDRGTRNRPRTLHATERDAQKSRKEMLALRDANAGGTPKMLHEWLTYWLDDIIAVTRKPGTLVHYRQAVDHWIAPRIPRLRLDQIRPEHIRSMQARMRRDGATDARVRRVTEILQVALSAAVRDGLMLREPCAAILASMPKTRSTPHPELPWDLAVQAINATGDPRTRARLALGFMAGLRQAEILGLRWADITLSQTSTGAWRGAVTIAAQAFFDKGTYRRIDPKSWRGDRIIPLDGAPAAILAAWRDRCTTELLFPSRLDPTRPTSPATDRDQFRAALKAAGVPVITPHGARATYTTRLLDSGVSVATAARVIGNDPAVLLRTYARASADGTAAIVRALEA